MSLRRLFLVVSVRMSTAAAANMEPKALRHSVSGPRPLPSGLIEREHHVTCPLDWRNPGAATVDVYCREVVLAKHQHPEQLPWLLYLQGGPGFPSPRPSAPPTGWLKRALEDFRVLLLDQRGTGRSTPLTAETLERFGTTEEQAEYVSNFRADSIVMDCEAIRRATTAGEGTRITILGQSFGGFCALTYLSMFPGSLERALLTCGLGPVGQAASAVYENTFDRMAERNRRFYQKYPGDVAKVREVVQLLLREPARLPGGGELTARRFLQLGLLLGSSSGFESLHYLLEAPFVGGRDTGGGNLPLSWEFLQQVESKQAAFETNPVYWFLHEAIYADGPRQPTAWAAHRVLQARIGSNFDAETTLAAGPDMPVYFTGEMVFPWMAEDYAGLRALRDLGDALASKDDWPRLYDEEVLRNTPVPVAALVAYDDIYVERAFSEAVAALLGPKANIWVTNQYAHSGLRDDPGVLSKLLEMSCGEGGIPS